MVHKAQHVTHGDQKVSGEEDNYKARKEERGVVYLSISSKGIVTT